MRILPKISWKRAIGDAGLLLLGAVAIDDSSLDLRLTVGVVGLAALLWRIRVSRNTERERVGKILDAIAEPIYMKNRKHQYTVLNRAFCESLGFSREALIGKTASRFLSSAEAKFFWDHDELVFRTGESSVFEAPLTDPAGVVHTLLSSKSLYRDSQGEPFIAGVIRDITQRKQAEEGLRLSQERYAAVVDGTNDGILDWDLDARRVFVSDRWLAMLGFDRSEIGDSPAAVLALAHPDDLPGYQNAKSSHFRGEIPFFEMEIRMRHKDGSYRWMLSRGRAIRDGSGRPVRMAGAQTDITPIKELEERLRHDSTRDPLTGLFNRRHFLDVLSPAILSARRHDHSLSLCMVDLDHFKSVNDLHGHGKGDEVLRVFGSFVLEELRAEDVAARFGGDEFCLLFAHSSAAQAAQVLERIGKRLREHVFLGGAGEAFHATATFGVCDVVTGDDAISALAGADRALYAAKRRGRDRSEIVSHPAGDRVPFLAAVN
ncbi:MAG: sensor domain-containing diguanylate cyclase [Thermoanaerobaculia bacterium]